ncbi:MAG: hypothetical protein ACRDO8_01300, partial [Nocardioidaceae bacterium]
MSDSLRKRAAKILAPLVLGAMAVAGAPAQADEAPTTAPVTGSANRPVHAAGASCGADLTEADLTEAARYGGVERD